MGWDNSLDPTTAPYGVLMSAKDYWSKLSPDERSAEMKRRMATRKSNGKKKSTKRVKKSNRTKARRDNGNGPTQTQEAHTLEGEIKYLYGKVETLIEFRAHSNGIPFATLAEGVANLLRR